MRNEYPKIGSLDHLKEDLINIVVRAAFDRTKGSAFTLSDQHVRKAVVEAFDSASVTFSMSDEEWSVIMG